MRAQNIRALQKRRPFMPFELVLETGDTYRVTHPEQVAVAETVVFWTDGARKWTFFGPENVTETRSLRNGSSRRR